MPITKKGFIILALCTFLVVGTPIGQPGATTPDAADTDPHEVQPWDLLLGDLSLTRRKVNDQLSKRAKQGENEETAKKEEEPKKKDPFPWNLKNTDCDSLASLRPKEQWKSVDGDKMLVKFENWFLTNKLICEDCLGKDKEDCTSKDDNCKAGLSDLSKRGDSADPRWDTAAAHFSQTISRLDLTCAIGATSCVSPPSCDETNGPGGFALMKSLTTAHNSFQNIYTAIESAYSRALGQMKKFSEIFAPLPHTNEFLLTAVGTALAGGLLGFIPGAGGIVSATAVGVAASVGMDNIMNKMPSEADTASALGTIVKDTLLQKYADLTDALFKDGKFSYKDKDEQDKTIMLADFFQDGKSLESSHEDKDFYTKLVPDYTRIMYQQLAVFTWQELQQKDAVVPFIAFDNSLCHDVDHSSEKSLAGSGIIEDIKSTNTAVGYEGKCYYLLSAKTTAYTSKQHKFSRRQPQPLAVTPSSPLTYNICGGAHALPGADAGTLNDNASEFEDLKLDHFVIPSVKGWHKHKESNDYEIAASGGEIVSDIMAPGTLNIPVCDYLKDQKSPGKKCPKLGGLINGKEKCKVF